MACIDNPSTQPIEEPIMWKKLALLATVASVVTQVVRYWNQAGPKTAAQRKRQARQDVNRWEDEGGNLRPDTAKDTPARS